MKRYIYLLRHGNPGEEESPKRCLGTTEVSLSDYGRRQIQRSKEYITNLGWTKVYSSPMKRCIETAQCLDISLGEVIIRDDLREMAAGIWENLTFQEIKSGYPDLYEKRGKALGTFAVEGAESFKKAGERFFKCLEEIRRETDENILVIAHAGVIRGFLCALTGKNYDDVMDFSIPYGSVTVLEETEEEWKLVENGICSLELLDEKEIQRLYQKCHTPERVIVHMEKVAEKVLQIMQGKENQNFFDEKEIELVYKAALVHDIRRTEKDHAKKSADFLTKEGYKAVAGLVALHHSDVMGTEESIKLHEILFYADKLVQDDKEVSIEERFANSFKKCKGSLEAEEKHRRLYEKTILIRNKIQKSFRV